MKLSLSTQAIERLLGGDSELEIELRHQIVREFSKRHLHEIVKTETYQEFMRNLRTILTQVIQEEVGTLERSGSWSTSVKYELKDQIKSLIIAAVNDAVTEALNKCIDDRIKYYECSWANHIDNKIKAIFNQSIDKQVNDEIARRLKVAAEIK